VSGEEAAKATSEAKAVIHAASTFIQRQKRKITSLAQECAKIAKQGDAVDVKDTVNMPLCARHDSKTPLSQLEQQQQPGPSDPGRHGAQPLEEGWEDVTDETEHVLSREKAARYPKLKLEPVVPAAATVQVGAKKAEPGPVVAPPVAAAAKSDDPGAKTCLEAMYFRADGARNMDFLRERIVMLACQARNARLTANRNAQRGFIAETTRYGQAEEALNRALDRAVGEFQCAVGASYLELDDAQISENRFA
jgi:hypothetical protein